MRQSRALLLGPALIVVFVMSASVWALADSSPDRGRAPAAIPRELTDPGWAQRNPDLAPEIKKIQYLYAEDAEQALNSAAGALSSPDPALREYGALVLGAAGAAEHLQALADLIAADSVPAVRDTAELAQARIRARLARGSEEKLLSVLSPALKSENRGLRLWAAQTLATLRSSAARDLRTQVLRFEQDPDVRSALQVRR